MTNELHTGSLIITILQLVFQLIGIRLSVFIVSKSLICRIVNEVVMCSLLRYSGRMDSGV